MTALKDWAAGKRDALRIGIAGDGFMRPPYFRAALERDLAGRELDITTTEDPWPLKGATTKRDPGIGVAEFLNQPEDYFDFVASREVLVTHLAPVTAETFARAPDLRIVAVARGGPVNVDVDAARARGVCVLRAPGRNASAVAEFTVASLLAETRNLVRGHLSVKAGDFSRVFYHSDYAGPELRELHVGIVGYGEIGRRVARLLAPFGCRMSVYDPYAELGEEEAGAGIEKLSLDDMLRSCDVITLHPRVTKETIGLISRERIATMKKGAYLVNTTRGQIVDYDALYEALAGGHLRGAALDTFNPEPPPPDSPLLQLPNVTLSPHIAGASQYSIHKSANTIATDIARIMAGEDPLNAVV